MSCAIRADIYYYLKTRAGFNSADKRQQLTIAVGVQTEARGLSTERISEVQIGKLLKIW